MHFAFILYEYSSYGDICTLDVITVKKVNDFPSPAGMSLTKLSLGGNIFIIPGQGEFGK